MSEIPMPGDYGQEPPPEPEKQGFCSEVCEWSCKGLAACCICLAFIFIMVMMILFGAFGPFGMF